MKCPSVTLPLFSAPAFGLPYGSIVSPPLSVGHSVLQVQEFQVWLFTRTPRDNSCRGPDLHKQHPGSILPFLDGLGEPVSEHLCVLVVPLVEEATEDLRDPLNLCPVFA